MPAISRRERLRRALVIVEASCVTRIEPSIPADDPDAWRGPFGVWRRQACVVRERCFSGVAGLHLNFAEWAIAHDDVPCTRATFEKLLTEAGFLWADGMVSGLIFKADLEAAFAHRGHSR